MGSEEFESETVGLPIGIYSLLELQTVWGDKADEQKDERKD